MLIEKQRIPELKKRALNRRDEELRFLATPEDFIIKRITPDLEDSFRMLAVLSFLGDGDIDGFHHNMYLAAKVRQRFLRCVRQGMKTPPGFLLATYDRAIWEALCSGNPEVTEALAKDKLSTGVNERLDNPYYFFFALGLRFILLGYDSDAKETLKDFDAARGDTLAGYSKVVHAVLDSDENEFNEGLRLAVEQREEEIRDDMDVNVGEQWLFVEGVALARVGRSKGLTMTYESALIPRELLGSPKAPYPDGDRILPAIPSSFTSPPEPASDEDEEDEPEEPS